MGALKTEGRPTCPAGFPSVLNTETSGLAKWNTRKQVYTLVKTPYTIKVDIGPLLLRKAKGKGKGQQQHGQWKLWVA